MCYHTTGTPITQIVTLMQEDYNPEPKVFIKKLVDYILPLKSKIAKYYELNPNPE